MTQEEQTLVMNLSQEEVLFLSRLLGGATIPGVGENIFENATERDVAIAVGVAERALIARGLLVPKAEGKADINEAAAVLVGACMHPEYSVLMEQSTAQVRRGVYWHALPQLVVEHAILLPGIHKFEGLLTTKTDLTDRIESMIGEYPQQKPLQEEGALEESLFNEGRDLARDQNDIDGAARIFEQGGLSARLSGHLARAIAENASVIQIMFIRHPDSDDQDGWVEGRTAIFSNDASLITYPEETQVHVQGFDPVRWRAWTEANLQRLQNSKG